MKEAGYMVNWITKKLKKGRGEKTGKSTAPEKGRRQSQGSDTDKKRESPQPRQRQENNVAKKADRKRDEARERERSGQEQKWSPEMFGVEAEAGKTRFHDLDLPVELMHAVADLGFKYCTPVQAKTLPQLLAGKDVAGQAQTGTGKTAAFLLGIFSHFLRNPGSGKRRNGTPRALVVAPTRELVVQLGRDADSLAKYAGFKTMAVYGGLDYAKQEKQLRGEKVDLIAATPGRLLDYLRKRIVDLSQVEILVLDEADRMLDMGFIPDVRRIVRATPKNRQRQTLLFSATLDEPVTRISKPWMNDPVRVEVDPENIAAESVDQKVYIVTDEKKYPLLYNILKKDEPERAIIFANRRDAVDRLTRQLKAHGFKCNQLSGAVSQRRRMRTLDDFRKGKFNLMVATDVAGRGLHIEGISHIINFNVPHDAEDYVHRIGRTGRAGCEGTSITFACEMESFYLPPIEELLGYELEYSHPEEEWLQEPPKATPRKRSGRSSGQRGRGGRSGKPRGRRRS